MRIQKLKKNFYKAAGQAKLSLSFKQLSYKAVAILDVTLNYEAQ